MLKQQGGGCHVYCVSRGYEWQPGNHPARGTGSTASGVGLAVFDSEAVALDYSFVIQGVDFGSQTPDLGDNVTRTHFHTAAVGVPGPIVFGQIDGNPALVQDKDDLSIVLNADGSWSVSGRPRIESI